jgi:hypothetical protein
LGVSLSVLVSAARADQVTLKNGDRLTGTIVKSDGKTLLLKTDSAGDVNVKWDDVSAIVSSQPLSLELENGQIVSGNVTTDDGKFDVATPERGQVAAPRDSVVAIRNAEEQSTYDRLKHPRITDFWSGLLDTGLSETRGNSALLAFSLAGKGARVAPRDKLSLYATAVYATDNTTPPAAPPPMPSRVERASTSMSRRAFLSSASQILPSTNFSISTCVACSAVASAFTSSRPPIDVFAGGDYDQENFSPNPPLTLTSTTRRHCGSACWRRTQLETQQSRFVRRAIYCLPQGERPRPISPPSSTPRQSPSSRAGSVGKSQSATATSAIPFPGLSPTTNS